MVNVLPDLIVKEDNSEIIRDQIALILAQESANQVALAVAASEPDPSLWELRVFTERSNPWEQELNKEDQSPAGAPIVNVSFDNSNIDNSKSNSIARQKLTGTYNIDCYGFGVSQETDEGHTPGDLAAALASQRAVKFVRNILMAALNRYLQLQDSNGKRIVWDRDVRSITSFEPKLDNTAKQKVVAARIAFDVGYSEFAPQITGGTIEFISVDIKRASDGQVIAEADYDYST